MNGVGAGASGDVRTWSIGLVNASGHYLTAESFGCKINASAVSMKKKQLWTLEHVNKAADVEVEVVYLKSHLGRYLSCDKKGNTKCEDEDRSNTDTQFVIDYCPSSGRWAFRSKQHGLFFGGQEDFLLVAKDRVSVLIRVVFVRPYPVLQVQVVFRRLPLLDCADCRRRGWLKALTRRLTLATAARLALFL